MTDDNANKGAVLTVIEDSSAYGPEGAEPDSRCRFLQRAVAHWLYLKSRHASHADLKIYRAAALRLLGEPIPTTLMRAAERADLDDDPLYHEGRHVADGWLAYKWPQADSNEKPMSTAERLERA